MTESDNINLKICRYCGKSIKEEEIICGFCGFNTKTNTLSAQAANKPHDEQKVESQGRKESLSRMVMPFIGIAVIVLLSLLLFSGKSKRHGSIQNKPNHSSKITEPLGILKKVFQEKKHVKEKNDEIFYVDGILFDTHGKSFATINEKVLSAGESIRNIKIIKINEDSVEVVVDGKNKILKVSQSIPFPKE